MQLEFHWRIEFFINYVHVVEKSFKIMLDFLRFGFFVYYYILRIEMELLGIM
jgi:hypothetical protein